MTTKTSLKSKRQARRGARIDHVMAVNWYGEPRVSVRRNGKCHQYQPTMASVARLSVLTNDLKLAGRALVSPWMGGSVGWTASYWQL